MLLDFYSSALAQLPIDLFENETVLVSFARNTTISFSL